MAVGKERRDGSGRHFRVYDAGQQDNWEKDVCEGDGNRRIKYDETLRLPERMMLPEREHGGGCILCGAC